MGGVKTRIVIADDHRLFREGLKRILQLEPDMEVVGEAADGVEAVQLVRSLAPDVLLFDVYMPRMSGVQMLQSLRGVGGVKFVAITASDEDGDLSSLSTAGVHGYVLKASGVVELLSAIRSVLRGELYVDQRLAGRLLTSFRTRKEERDVERDLTPREREVLYWLSQGFENAEIATRIVLSEKTVKNHVSHILRKLDLRDRTQAAVLAWRVGFAQLPPERAIRGQQEEKEKREREHEESDEGN